MVWGRRKRRLARALAGAALCALVGSLAAAPPAAPQPEGDPEARPTGDPLPWHPGGPELRVEPVAEGFTAPVDMTTPPDEPERLFVVDRPGQIWVVEDGRRRAEPFLDIGARIVMLDAEDEERGLLGLAFHPDYSENGRFFVHYTAPARDEAPAGAEGTGLSVDLATGDLYAFESGGGLLGEVNLIEPGGNYGWAIREGLTCFNPDDPTEPLGDCPDEGARGEPLIDPIVAWDQPPERGTEIVAGVRYRGTELQQFIGRLIFGDRTRDDGEPRGVIYMATEPGDDGPWPVQEARVVGGEQGTLGRYLLGVVQDGTGEAYALTSREEGPELVTGELVR